MKMRHKKVLCLLMICIAAFLLCSCSTHVVRKPDTSSVDNFIDLSPSAPAAPDAVVSPDVSEDPVQSPEPTFEAAPQPPATVLGETADMGQEYLDSIIFLGDSTTYGMKYYGVLSGGKDTQQVWTPSSGTLTLSYQGFATIVYPPTGEEIPIREAVERTKPAMMVITLGVNGVSFMDEDYFKSEYTSLVSDIKAISPDTRIILQSIFPVASTYEYLSSINNTNITEANKWVLAVAEETGCRYLDTTSVLVGEDGWLPQEYQNGDGLHLNEVSFGIVTNYIRTHGWV